MSDTKTSGTTWVIPEGGIQIFRGTFCRSGRLEMARGGRPTFNPETARYATSDMVTNIAAANGIAIHGDLASARRFLACAHVWKQTMTLDELIAHPYLGKTMPSKDTIIAAYKADLEEVIEA
jgi:hypothetical protein